MSGFSPETFRKLGVERPEPDTPHVGPPVRCTSGKRLLIPVPWPRLPNAPALPRDPAPTGLRPPNRAIWAHDPSEFRFIQRYMDFPGTGIVQTLWSRSQIASFEQNYGKELCEVLFDDPGRMPPPRRKKIWPLLKLPRREAMRCDPPLGLIDEGSDHDEERPLEIALEDDSDVEHEVTPLPDDPMYPTCIPWECKDAGWKEHVVDRVLYRDGKRRKTRLVVKIRGAGPGATQDGDGNDADDEDCGKGKQKQKQDTASSSTLAALDLAVPQQEQTATAQQTTTNTVMQMDAAAFAQFAQHAEQEGENEGEEEDEEEEEEEDERIEWPCLPKAYSIEGIPTLQEKIPKPYFPQTLLVHDPYHISYGVQPHKDATPNVNSEPIVYTRLYPPPDSRPDGPVARMYLNPANLLGSGSHSLVYATPLHLPPPLSTYEHASNRPGVVRVAAKLGRGVKEAREELKNEAEIYSGFPGHFTEEYCGWNVWTPFMQSPVPVHQVVPKFYGYYVPERKGRHLERGKNGRLLWPWERRSPILLMEDCGVPINVRELSIDDRAECYSFIIRLHFADVHHNPFTRRNILVQPGPLTLPPHLRSLKAPSFRCVDFGATYNEAKWREKEYPVGKAPPNEEEKEHNMMAFQRAMLLEWHAARQELGFDLTSRI